VYDDCGMIIQTRVKSRQ